MPAPADTTGRPGPKAIAQASRAVASRPRPAGLGIGSAAIAAITRSSKPTVGATYPLEAYDSRSRASQQLGAFGFGTEVEL